MDQWNSELDNLFAEYKAMTPDPDATANFMPGLWQKIEARQTLVFRIKRLTQVFVAAAAAICVVLALMGVPSASESPSVAGNYVDVLAEIHPAESLAPLGLRADSE